MGRVLAVHEPTVVLEVGRARQASEGEEQHHGMQAGRGVLVLRLVRAAMTSAQTRWPDLARSAVDYDTRPPRGRTKLFKTDITNRAISLYEFIDHPLFMDNPPREVLGLRIRTPRASVKEQATPVRGWPAGEATRSTGGPSVPLRRASPRQQNKLRSPGKDESFILPAALASVP